MYKRQVFLLVCLFRAIAGGFTPKQHFGFEAAAWYWHFVDVVWLFLFFAIYIWGCLLYTSDAADDMQCVDLGGRRIIKKKKRA